MENKTHSFHLEPEFLEYFNGESWASQVRILNELIEVVNNPVIEPPQKMKFSKRAAIGEINGRLKIIGQFREAFD